jgi:hypothetical protein
MTLAAPGQLNVPAPATRLAALRILVVGFALGYLLARLPHLLDVARLADTTPGRFVPVGPLVLLRDPAPVPVALAVVAATLVAGVAALVGWRWRASGPVFAVSVLVVLSYRNSWGQIFHTENLLVLHLGILALTRSADAWSLDARRHARAGNPPRPVDPRYGWPAQLMAVVVVVAYVLAGWAKVRASGFGWAGGDALRNLVAHDALRKELVGDSAAPIGVWALRHGWIFPPLAVLSLAVELLAPVALLGGRWRLGWVGAAWLFHLGVLVVMGIMFPYQVLGVAFACFVAVESLPERWRRRTSARSRPDRASLAA